MAKVQSKKPVQKCASCKVYEVFISWKDLIVKKNLFVFLGGKRRRCLPHFAKLWLIQLTHILFDLEVGALKLVKALQ